MEEYDAAAEMQDLLDKAMEKVNAGEDPLATLSNREESDENDVVEMLEELFAAVVEAKDPNDGRSLHMQFRFLPSQKVLKLLPVIFFMVFEKKKRMIFF